MRLALTLLVLLAVPLPSVAASRAAVAAAEKAAASVVLVEYVLEKPGRGFSGIAQRLELASIGTLVSRDGLVLLSGSVFPDDPAEEREPAMPRDFEVRLPGGERLKATLVGRAKDPSACFLRLEAAPGREFPHLELDESAARDVAAGDELLLTGLLPEKYGYQPTFTRAMASALVSGAKRRIDVDAHVQDAMVGAPAFDAQGRPVGLLLTDPMGDRSAGVLASPLKLFGALTRGKEPGFPLVIGATELAPLIASPPRDVPTVARARSWLGVTLQPVTRALAAHLGIRGATGAMITSVWKGSPAEAAGLRPEDVIVSLAGRDVQAVDDEGISVFIERVRAIPIGDTVEVKFLRGLEPLSTAVTLAEAPKTAVLASEYRSPTFGLAAQDVTIDIALSRGWPEETRGALISELETAGWAQVGGLQLGDLILAVAGQPVGDVQELEAALTQAEAQRPTEVIFFVLRDPDTLFVPVKTQF